MTTGAGQIPIEVEGTRGKVHRIERAIAGPSYATWAVGITAFALLDHIPDWAITAGMLCYLQGASTLTVLYALNRYRRFRAQQNCDTLFRGLYMGGATAINIFPASFTILEAVPDGWPTLATLLGITSLTGLIALDTIRTCWKLAPLSFLTETRERRTNRKTPDV